MRITSARTYLTATLLALAATAGGQWVEDSIDVGGRWVGSLAYNSRARVVYGCSQSDNRFFAISCDSNRVVESYWLPWPRHISYDSVDNKAYCTYMSGGDDYVAVIDGDSHLKVDAIPLDWANYTVWDPVSDRLYVSCLDNNEVAVIDCTTDSVIARIGVGRDPVRMYLNTRHRKLYVLNTDSESMSIVDLESHEVVETISLGNVPDVGCYSHAADKCYCGVGSRLVVVDGAGDSVVAHVQLHGGILDITSVESESLVMAVTYVGTGDDDTLYVVDAMDSVVSRLARGRDPSPLYWSAVTNLVYCATRVPRNVLVIASDGSAVQKVLPSSAAPSVFACCPPLRRLYLAHYSTTMVYVIRDSACGVQEERSGPFAAEPGLHAAPNPFRDRVRITTEASPVAQASVFAQDGRVLARLSRSQRDRSTFFWDGSDQAGRTVPPGVYVIALAGTGSRRVNVVKLR